MIKLIDLDFSYHNHSVFESLNLEFESEAIHIIMGHSGCGKTTLLNLLATLLTPQRGIIEGIANKRVSYIFQEPRLLPWRTVLDNIKLTLNTVENEQDKQYLALDIIRKVGLSRFKDSYPSQLSGGMKQRVSMARAFAYPSDLILLDEPFQNLDFKLKEELSQLFQCLWDADKRTVVCVTHDVDEAMKLGHFIYFLPSSKTKKNQKYTLVEKNKSEIIDRFINS